MRRLAVAALAVGLFVTGCEEMPRRGQLGNTKGNWEKVRVELALQEARRQLGLDDLQGARSGLEAAIRSGVDDVRFHLLLARIAIDQGNYAEAYRVVHRARLIQPDSAGVDAVSGVLEESQGNWDAARAAYAMQASKSFGASQPVLAQVRVLHAAGRADDAASVLLDEFGRGHATPELLFSGGEALLAAGHPEAAVRYIREALSRQPDHVPSQYLLGVSLHAIGNHEEGYEVLARLSEVTGSPEYTHLALARSSMLVWRFQLAADHLRTFLATYPDSDEAWADLSRVLLLNGDVAEAETAIRRALALRPESADGYMLLGHIQTQAGDSVGAAGSYVKAVSLGADAAVLSGIMESLRQRGKAP